MFCFYCLKEDLLFEDTVTGDLVCTWCGACDAHHVTFGDTLPRRQDLNPMFFCSKEDTKEPRCEAVGATGGHPKQVVRRGRPRKNKEEGTVLADPFMGALKELSRYVPIDRRDIRRLHASTLRVLEKDTTLRFVLPAAVVLSVYWESERVKKEVQLEYLCTVLRLKVCTVNRILKMKRKIT